MFGKTLEEETTSETVLGIVVSLKEIQNGCFQIGVRRRR